MINFSGYDARYTDILAELINNDSFHEIVLYNISNNFSKVLECIINEVDFEGRDYNLKKEEDGLIISNDDEEYAIPASKVYDFLIYIKDYYYNSHKLTEDKILDIETKMKAIESLYPKTYNVESKVSEFNNFVITRIKKLYEQKYVDFDKAYENYYTLLVKYLTI